MKTKISTCKHTHIKTIVNSFSLQPIIRKIKRLAKTCTGIAEPISRRNYIFAVTLLWGCNYYNFT